MSRIKYTWVLKQHQINMPSTTAFKWLKLRTITSWWRHNEQHDLTFTIWTAGLQLLVYMATFWPFSHLRCSKEKRQWIKPGHQRASLAIQTADATVPPSVGGWMTDPWPPALWRRATKGLQTESWPHAATLWGLLRCVKVEQTVLRLQTDRGIQNKTSCPQSEHKRGLTGTPDAQWQTPLSLPDWCPQNMNGNYGSKKKTITMLQ